jgi:hypothetical protein
MHTHTKRSTWSVVPNSSLFTLLCRCKQERSKIHHETADAMSSLVPLDLFHFTAEDTQPGIFATEFGLFLVLCIYRDESRKFKVLMSFSIMITVLMPLQLGALTQTTVTKIWHTRTRTFHLHRNRWNISGPIATYRLLNPAKFCRNILHNAGIFTNKTTMYEYLH